jgi:hypothetical protein
MTAKTRGFSRLTWGAYGIAGNADNPVLFAEQIKRLDGFLGETDNAAGRELAHERDMQNKRWLATVAVN